MNEKTLKSTKKFIDNNDVCGIIIVLKDGETLSYATQKSYMLALKAQADVEFEIYKNKIKESAEKHIYGDAQKENSVNRITKPNYLG